MTSLGSVHFSVSVRIFDHWCDWFKGLEVMKPSKTEAGPPGLGSTKFNPD